MYELLLRSVTKTGRVFSFDMGGSQSKDNKDEKVFYSETPIQVLFNPDPINDTNLALDSSDRTS